MVKRKNSALFFKVCSRGCIKETARNDMARPSGTILLCLGCGVALRRRHSVKLSAAKVNSAAIDPVSGSRLRATSRNADAGGRIRSISRHGTAPFKCGCAATQAVSLPCDRWNSRSLSSRSTRCSAFSPSSTAPANTRGHLGVGNVFGGQRPLAEPITKKERQTILHCRCRSACGCADSLAR